ncbi:MAG TPA: EamA family transporter [Micromonosporaceae bacterium]|nr:EamA family transporter [Micromonosporaceae bacterium]
MRTKRGTSLAALAGAGVLWGTTVPLTKVSLDWLGPGWLTVLRFGVATLLLAWPARRKLRAAVTPGVLAWGAFGYGAVIVVQNAGIARTSVSHAALLVGALPILVALIGLGLGRARVGRLSWLAFLIALGGVALVAAGGGGSATLAGDGLVAASVLLCAAFLVAQPGMLAGRDPMAVTAVQFAAATLAALPAAGWLEGVPSAPAGSGVLLAVAGLVLGGTLVPFTLFAYGQSRVAPEVAGAFLNLEPLVGALAGAVVFADPVGPVQLVGATAILGGIGLSVAVALARPVPYRLGGRAGGGGADPVIPARPAAERGPTASEPASGPASGSVRTGGPAGRIASSSAVAIAHRYSTARVARSSTVVGVPRPTASRPTARATPSGSAGASPAMAQRRRVDPPAAARHTMASTTAATASTLAPACTRSATVDRSYGGSGHPAEQGSVPETVPRAPAEISSTHPTRVR